MYRALIICNSTFPSDTGGLPSLHGPRSDGLHLWRAITRLDGGLFTEQNVDVLHEHSKAQIEQAAENFFRSASSEDTLLFYYSGHGESRAGSLYLCGLDSKLMFLRSTAVSTDELNKMISESHAATIIILLDCCYSGAFKGETPIPKLGGRGRYVITATTAIEPASDSSGSGETSPFTTALVRSLERKDYDSSSQDDVLTLDGLYADVSRQMADFPGTMPKRDFDGAGEVAICRRPVLSISEHVSDVASVTPPVVEPPVVEPPVPTSTEWNWSRHARVKGDLSPADARLWVTEILIAGTGFLVGTNRLLQMSDNPGNLSYATNDDSAVLTLGLAVILLGIWVLVSLVEGRISRGWLAGKATRRIIMLRLDSPAAKALRIAKLVVATLTTLMFVAPIVGIGFADWYFVLVFACLATLIGLVVAERFQFGDSAVFIGGLVFAVGNFIPLSTGWPAFTSSVHGPVGVIRFFIGLVVLLGWWQRLPQAVFWILALSATLCIIDGPFEEQGNGWIICGVGLAALILGLLTGGESKMISTGFKKGPSGSLSSRHPAG